MSSLEFLNVAHAALVEEFMRPRTTAGTTIPGMSLEDALKLASPWAEGEGLRPSQEGRQVPPAVRQEAPQKSEEEIVAQNERAMQHLMASMSNVSGGFTRK